MHYEHGRPAMDALPLKLGDEVILPRGRVGVVAEIERDQFTFTYAGTSEQVALTRRFVAGLIK